MRDIDVYGTIGADWFDEASVTAKEFVAQLRDAGGDDVTVHVNSGGGDVFEAQTMSEAIRSYKGRVTCSIEGLAASAASFFALTADEVVMNPSALLMVHNPLTLTYGNAADMRESAELLDKVAGTIVRQYVRKTGMGEADVRALMDAETWMDADEALERGFVDRLTDAEPVAACVSARLFGRYSHVPEGVSVGASAPDGAAAGDTGASILTDEGERKPDAGAAKGEAEAVSRVVCVKGQFLYV